MILELVVGELTGEPEFLDLVPVAPAPVDAQGRGLGSAAMPFVISRSDDA
ncbi:hypothetical protein [Streptomyces flavidovirens]|uniref:GNAT family N-acetyltransferase n=1 Tax=Streptomyces flavidovirens TaxID=67298 RepID=A0ABW6RPV3_9ACTN